MSQMQRASDDELLNETLTTIANNTGGISGTGTHGQTVCTSANTWYEIPSTVPAGTYQLFANAETVAGTLRVSFLNSGTPSTTVGVIWPKGTPLTVILGTSDSLYVSSSNAGDTVNWTAKLLV